MPTITARTAPGVYSANKETMKDLWGSMGYKYRGGYTPTGPGGSKDESLGMKVMWAPADSRLRQEAGDLGVYATFHGHGGPAEFTVVCRDNELAAFEVLFGAIGATVEKVLATTADTPADVEALFAKAKAEVDAKWSWPKQEKGEPELFFKRRLQKARGDYDERVMNLVEKWTTQGIDVGVKS